MKNLNLLKKNPASAIILLSCLIFFLAFSSCEEKTNTIGGVVTNYQTEEPIAGVVMGLYNYIKDTNSLIMVTAEWQDFELIDEAITDSDGKFSIVVDRSLDIMKMFYLLKPISDTISKNCNYTITNSDYTYRQPDWGTNVAIKLAYAGKLFVNVQNIIIGDTIRIANGDYSYTIPSSGSGEYDYLLLEPGKQHSVRFYLQNSETEQLIESRNIYVRPIPADATGRVIKDIPSQQTDIELNNY